jgi:hypothetical protein
MGTSAAYRNLSESESENSTPASTLNSKGPQLLQEVQQCRNPKTPLNLTPRQVARTLNELIEMGMVVKFRDEYGIERYRSTRIIR